MNNLASARASFKDQLVIAKRRHTWIMSWLYIGTVRILHRLLRGVSHSSSRRNFPRITPRTWRLVGLRSWARLPVPSEASGWRTRLAALWSARVTFWNFVAMTMAALGIVHAVNSHQLGAFVAMFLVLFVTTGLGNGSTYRMIPVIFRNEKLREVAAAAGPEAREAALKAARIEGAAVPGLRRFPQGRAPGSGYSSFPARSVRSIKATGSVSTALAVFVAFYATSASSLPGSASTCCEQGSGRRPRSSALAFPRRRPRRKYSGLAIFPKPWRKDGPLRLIVDESRCRIAGEPRWSLRKGSLAGGHVAWSSSRPWPMSPRSSRLLARIAEWLRACWMQPHATIQLGAKRSVLFIGDEGQQVLTDCRCCLRSEGRRFSPTLRSGRGGPRRRGRPAYRRTGLAFASDPGVALSELADLGGWHHDHLSLISVPVSTPGPLGGRALGSISRRTHRPASGRVSASSQVVASVIAQGSSCGEPSFDGRSRG